MRLTGGAVAPFSPGLRPFRRTFAPRGCQLLKIGPGTSRLRARRHKGIEKPLLPGQHETTLACFLIAGDGHNRMGRRNPPITEFHLLSGGQNAAYTIGDANGRFNQADQGNGHEQVKMSGQAILPQQTSHLAPNPLRENFYNY
jgi:hypothetical protein